MPAFFRISGNLLRNGLDYFAEKLIMVEKYDRGIYETFSGITYC